MKPPRRSLAICNTPSITPVPAVIKTRKTSITIRIAMEFQVCFMMVKMMQPKTISISPPRMKDETSIPILTSSRRMARSSTTGNTDCTVKKCHTRPP